MFCYGLPGEDYFDGDDGVRRSGDSGLQDTEQEGEDFLERSIQKIAQLRRRAEVGPDVVTVYSNRTVHKKAQGVEEVLKN